VNIFKGIWALFEMVGAIVAWLWSIGWVLFVIGLFICLAVLGAQQGGV
jgi:hypothetical protein